MTPARGGACVFWTMDADGIDAAAWHNGARIAAGGGGKFIAQKFKELPPEHRADNGPPVLPLELMPRPLVPPGAERDGA